uniref:GCS light chain n=1 Tax=Acrobeloides nanus TaxID=290746 RepID=A0A914DKQ3_9BILA
MTANCAWQSLIARLHQLNKFRLHTGNINNYMELKIKRFKNSAEELITCLDLQFPLLKADLAVSEQGMVLLSDREDATTYERNDLKITLKVFLQEFDISHIENAIEATIAQLETDNIEQLIIAFPRPENEDDDTEVDKEWLVQVLNIWSELEKIVASGKVTSLGVADFNLVQLRALCQEANMKPCIDHFNIEGCCVVPPELQAYAKDQEIQLLTHNDPHPFPLADVFKTFCTLNASAPVCSRTFEPIWAARYANF